MELQISSPTHAKEILKSMGFLIFEDILDQEMINLIKDYMSFLEKYRLLKSYHAVPMANFISEDTLMRRILLKPMAEKLSDLLDLKLDPTYTFLIKYPEESALFTHVDQERCEWNLGIIIDQTKPVPFSLSSPEGEKYSFPLEINQAILYRGTTWPHGRDKIQDGCFLMSVVCHFLEK